MCFKYSTTKLSGIKIFMAIAHWALLGFEPRSLTCRVSVLTTALQDEPQHQQHRVWGGRWCSLAFIFSPFPPPCAKTPMSYTCLVILQVLQQQRFYTWSQRFGYRKEKRKTTIHPFPDLRYTQTPHASQYWKRPMTHQWGKRDLRPGKRARTEVQWSGTGAWRPVGLMAGKLHPQLPYSHQQVTIWDQGTIPR